MDSEASSENTEITKALQAQTLGRDGYRCVLTGSYDVYEHPGIDVTGKPTSLLEIAYIIPGALGFTVRDTSADIDRKTSAWGAINQFFPRLAEFGMTATTVDSVNNMILLAT